MKQYFTRKEQLYIEDVPVSELAHAYGTPLYIYSLSYLRDQYSALKKAMAGIDPLICYSVKANSNGNIIRSFLQQGSGLDIVSGGELFRAVRAGADPSKIVFAGVGKTADEIRYAIEQGILFFTTESEAEIERIQSVAAEKGTQAGIAIRVNPDVDAKTLKYTTTGKKENKFGIELNMVEALIDRVTQLPNIRVAGLHVHIGSQILSVEPFISALQKIKPLCLKLKAKLPHFEYLDIGGGIGIKYQPDHDPLSYENFSAGVVPVLKEIGLKIVLEPGRCLVGNAGAFLCRVQYLKKGSIKKFVVVDGGMNDLIRPSLYDAYQEIVAARNINEKIRADVVGPICESGDFLAKDRELPAVAEGDVLAVMSAGAYGFSMASTYNSRPLPPEVMVKDKSHHLIRRRQVIEELVEPEITLNLNEI